VRHSPAQRSVHAGEQKAISVPGHWRLRLTFWNRAAADTSVKCHLSLSKNARLFALLNLAMADAAISCWDAKYYYNFWRPITAINLTDTDGNPDTIADPVGCR
jgi:hypothetical protein